MITRILRPALALAALLAFAAPLRAQDSLTTVPDSTVVASDSALSQIPDTVPKPPLKPLGAFFRSFLIPGWGQAKLGRNLTAALFVAAEGATLAMSIKTTHELHHLERLGSPAADGKRREQQDWLVLLVANHLFSGLEAFVSAHLWDFPGDLRFEAAPGGGYSGRISIPVQLR